MALSEDLCLTSTLFLSISCVLSSLREDLKNVKAFSLCFEVRLRLFDQ